MYTSLSYFRCEVELYRLHINTLNELVWFLAYKGKGFNISKILRTWSLTLPKCVCIYYIVYKNMYIYKIYKCVDTEVHMYLAHAVVNEEYIVHKVSLTEFKVSLKMSTENHMVH